MIITVFSCVSVTNAKMYTDIEKVLKVIGLDIDLNSKIDLYNENEEIITNYYLGVESGYLIVNA